MNVQAQTDTELEALKRIVTMLFALAELGDRASRAPHPVRAFVLWLLRRGEAVVREWVAAPDHAWPVAIHIGSDPHDALDLAASFRALAHAVEDMAADHLRLRRWWRRDTAVRNARRAVDGNRFIEPGFRLPPPISLAPTPCDTS